MNPLTEEQLDELPLSALIQRMDAFLVQSHKERYGSSLASIELTSQLMGTACVRQRSETEQRKIAYVCFSYLVQLQMESVASGMTNKILYAEKYTEQDWLSPVFRLREGALRQYSTISSRIAFEIFIDLLHIIDTGERLSVKKSKLKSFRGWLKNVNNKFHYFAHVLLAAYEFDRGLRTPEVHGASRLPRRFLTLQMPEFQELNENNKLINTLMNVWRPLIDLLNNVRPTYMHVEDVHDEWFQIYMSGDDDEIEKKLSQLLSFE
jgi:hypothetical protein